MEEGYVADTPEWRGEAKRERTPGPQGSRLWLAGQGGAWQELWCDPESRCSGQESQGHPRQGQVNFLLQGEKEGGGGPHASGPGAGTREGRLSLKVRTGAIWKALWASLHTTRELALLLCVGRVA